MYMIYDIHNVFDRLSQYSFLSELLQGITASSIKYDNKFVFFYFLCMQK